MYTELRSPELGHGLTSQQPVQQIKNVNMAFLTSAVDCAHPHPTRLQNDTPD